MAETIVVILLFFVETYVSLGQKTGYNGTCASTEECSDHRYTCQFDDQNVLRCLCDRFHTWDEAVGCVQIYNASEILNMTVTATDNFRDFEEQVNRVMQTQIAAGLFVFGMVIVAALAVTGFCVYVHVTNRLKDRKLSYSALNAKARDQTQTMFQYDRKPATSTSRV